MIRVITAPAALPVTRTEAKAWCRIEAADTSQDTVLDVLIAAMTKYAEETKTGRAYVERTLELNLDCFAGAIELPFPPLIEIVSVKYTDIAGAEQTVDAADYEVDLVSEPGKVRPIRGKAWPAIGYGFNPVRIRYRAGYAYAGSPVDLTDNSYLPPQLRTWIAARLATLFENREQLVADNQVEIPRDFADGLLDALVIATRLF